MRNSHSTVDPFFFAPYAGTYMESFHKIWGHFGGTLLVANKEPGSDADVQQRRFEVPNG